MQEEGDVILIGDMDTLLVYTDSQIPILEVHLGCLA